MNVLPRLVLLMIAALLASGVYADDLQEKLDTHVAGLGSDDHEAAHFAARRLADLGEPGIAVLLERLSSESARMRYYAALGMCNTNLSAMHLKRVIACLERETDERVKCELLRSFEHLWAGVAPPVTLIGKYLDDPAASVRHAAASMLGRYRFDDDRIKQRLLKMLGESDMFSRSCAVDALAKTKLTTDDIERMPTESLSADARCTFGLLHQCLNDVELTIQFVTKFPLSVQGFAEHPHVLMKLLQGADPKLEGLREVLRKNSYLTPEVAVRLNATEQAPRLVKQAGDAYGDKALFLLACAWALDASEAQTLVELSAAKRKQAQEIIDGRAPGFEISAFGCGGEIRTAVAGVVVTDDALAADQVRFVVKLEDLGKVYCEVAFDPTTGRFCLFFWRPITTHIGKLGDKPISLVEPEEFTVEIHVGKRSKSITVTGSTFDVQVKP